MGAAPFRAFTGAYRMTFDSIDELQAELARNAYIADRSLTTAIYLALKLNKPLLLEGEAGVGKTEIAKTLARMQNRHLIRLQCYEGLDVNTTIYEWNYARQMIAIRMSEATGGSVENIFGPEFLIKRPLLQAIEESVIAPPVLLIDELDRADEEFEAFLLELLSDWQISIPEIGTISAANPPTVIITSNRTREVHDALKRRCLFYWVDYPSLEKELEIVRARVPGAGERLSRQVVMFVQELRRMDLYKLPGVAETLDWVTALVALDATQLSQDVVEDTLGAILKFQDDIAQVRGKQVNELLKKAAAV
jgi:MoxR-like ATPase